MVASEAWLRPYCREEGGGTETVTANGPLFQSTTTLGPEDHHASTMTRFRVFVSSVQSEFAAERQALKDYFREDPLLQRFFELFLFEDVPASDRRLDDVYLREVDKSDVYVGLLGWGYGAEDEAGVSPTEREYDRASERGIHRLVFVKGREDGARHPKTRSLIGKAQAALVRRRFDTTAELKTAVYASLVEFLESRNAVYRGRFDAAPCEEATLDDLDQRSMAQFIRAARRTRKFPLAEDVPPQTFLEHVNLLNKGHPTNAAVLLFGKSPQRFLPTSEIKCARFHGTWVAKPIPSYQVYRGTVFDLVDQAADFVLGKIDLSVGTRAESARAPVSYEIPKEVVMEAIVNAVVHRDYASNGSVQVMLFKDRLEVRNPGTLPTRLTLDQLRVPHNSVPTNPSLAHAMYLVEYIEKMGTGTLDMIRRCAAAGLAEPEFAVTDGFVATIRRSVDPNSLGGQVEGHRGGSRRNQAGPSWGRARPSKGSSGGQAGDQAHGEEGQAGIRAGPSRGQAAIPPLSSRDLGILRAAEAGPTSRKTLLVAGKYSRRSGSFRRRLARLVAGRLLEMTLPNKPTSPSQRYRLTREGRAALASAGHRRSDRPPPRAGAKSSLHTGE